MGIALDARDGFEAGQYLPHPAGFEAEQPIIGLIRIEVPFKEFLSERSETDLPLPSTFAPYLDRALIEVYASHTHAGEL